MNQGRTGVMNTSMAGQLDYAPMALALTVACSLPSLADLTREQAALGLGALTLLPLVFIAVSTRRLLISEPIVVLSLMWFLAVTLPAVVQRYDESIYRDPVWYKMTGWAIDQAALWMYRAWAACCVSYWAVRVVKRTSVPPAASQINLALEDRMRVFAGWLGLAGSIASLLLSGGQAYSHIEGFSTSSTLSMVAGEIRFFSIAYIFMHFHARGRSRLTTNENYLLLVTLAAQALIFGASSTKLIAFEVGSAWLLGSAAGKTRGNPGKEIAVGLSALAFTYATFFIVASYREEIRMRPVDPQASYSQVLELQYEALSASVGHLVEGRQLGNDDSRYDTGSMLDRLAHVTSFARVLDFTSANSPYENAMETFATPFLAFLPRDLIGDKIQFMDSGTFARLQGWEFGGLSLTTPGSIFWAWGLEGILLTMAGIGAVLALLVHTGLADGPGGLIARVLALRLTVMMLDVGSDFQPLVINLTRSLAFLLVIQFAARASLPHQRNSRR